MWGFNVSSRKAPCGRAAAASWTAAELDAHFAVNSFAQPGSASASAADMRLFHHLKASRPPSAEKWPHLARWLRHVESYGQRGVRDVDDTVGSLSYGIVSFSHTLLASASASLPVLIRAACWPSPGRAGPPGWPPADDAS